MMLDLTRVPTALLFAAPLFSVVRPEISTVISMVFTLMALRHWWCRGMVCPSPLRTLGWRGVSVMVALYVYAAVLLLTNLMHGERWGAYHVVLAILILVPGWRILASGAFQVQALWAGAAAGGLLSFAVAAYQVFVLRIDRAGEHINPIPFGNLSLLLSVMSLAGILMLEPATAHRRRWLWLFAAGALAGVGAALLSGTKGAWLPMAVVVFMGFRVFASRVPRWKLSLGAAVMGVALLGMSLQPEVSLVPRIKEASTAFQRWMATGDTSDDSVGHRLQMWAFGWNVAGERPLTGYGKEGMIERKWEAIRTGQVDLAVGKYVTLHNEFLNMWVTKGAVGTLAMLGLYGSALLLFWPLRRHAHPPVRALATAGLCLVLLYVLFGLWEVAFQLNSYRNAFLFWLLALLGLLAREMQVWREQAGSGKNV